MILEGPSMHSLGCTKFSIRIKANKIPIEPNVTSSPVLFIVKAPTFSEFLTRYTGPYNSKRAQIKIILYSQ
jgi:hypothetical protein